MYGRTGLDRFKKAQTLEPFSVSVKSDSKNSTRSTGKTVSHSPSLPQSPYSSTQFQHDHVNQKLSGPEAAPLLGQTQQGTHVGGGQSTWQPPDWAIEPRPGVYYLEVLKDGQVVDRINLDKRRNLFGRQAPTCDFVLDHQSVSRQHAAVIPHKNGSVYVIDLGSVHGTFVANERMTKDSPVELEVGQSLRFAASTRTYILRKNDAALFYRPQRIEIDLPRPPDPSDEDAVVLYNTLLNRYGINSSDKPETNDHSRSEKDGNNGSEKERATKRMRKLRVSFKDQVGGQLAEVVGVSDGVDVETEPGLVGVKEGSLVGKYESLVQVTVIPKGKEQYSAKDGNISQNGVTDKLREVLNKVKTTPKGGIYDDLYGDFLSDKVGSSWAYSSATAGNPALAKDGAPNSLIGESNINTLHNDDEVDDDLFGD